MHRERVYFDNDLLCEAKVPDEIRWTVSYAVEDAFSLEDSEELSWHDLNGRSDCYAPSGEDRARGPILINDLLQCLDSEALTRSE